MVAVAFSIAWRGGVVTDLVVPVAAEGSGLEALVAFRAGVYGCLTGWADELFELVDAVLCLDGPVTSLPELSMASVHRRGHGTLYAGLSCGSIAIGRLRMALAALDLPRSGDRQLKVAVDVSPWPRPDAECSPERLHCHRPCRCDGVRQTIPGWPYSMIAALGAGRSSWTALLDARRIGPDDDLTEVTAAQIRDLIDRLRAAGQLLAEDPPVLVVIDSGYDIVRLTWLLADVPVRLLGRVRCDRVMWTRAPAARRDGKPGRPPRHGDRFALADPTTHTAPAQELPDTHDRFGKVRVHAYGHLHPKLEHRDAWAGHQGPMPIVEGTLIHIAVQHLPGDRDPKPMWLWFSDPDATACDLIRLWRTYLRRFDIEHTFRFLKQTLGWTRPRVRTPDQADRWTWLIIAAYTQLRLARHLTDDLRRPWDPPLDPAKLTPGRVRRGFRRVRRATGTPANAPKPTRPGTGRPKGRTSSPARRHPVGKKHHKPDITNDRQT